MSLSPLPLELVTGLLARLAREDGCVLLESSRPGPGDDRSLLFLQPVEVLRLESGDDPSAFFAALEGWRARGCHLAGWFAYELGYLLEPRLRPLLATGRKTVVLAEVGVYREPWCYDHTRGAFAGNRPFPLADPVHLGDYTITTPQLVETEETYLAAVAAIQEAIASGDTYQVNYTTRLRFTFQGDAAALYLDLRRQQSVAYSAFLRFGPRTILSLSPELFFRCRGDRLTARPMKGTIHRTGDPDEDRRLAAFLAADGKNRAENVMIVDLLRNDLGRVAVPGSVSVPALFTVEPYETLQQMTSTVEARLRPGTSLLELFRALFPCGSVTGAPKIRTMEIIAGLESTPRSVYTGAIGHLAPEGDLTFNVPIRTVVLEGERGELGIGSGIVHDSQGSAEWRECWLKARFLTSLAEPPRLIETFYWDATSGYWLLDLHLERLLASARTLGYRVRPQEVTSRLAAAAAGFAGDGGRRVRLLVDRDSNMEVTATPCPPPVMPDLPLFNPVQRPPVRAVAAAPAARVCLAPQPVDGHDPWLGHKTTRRRRYDRAWQRVQAAGFLDCLFCNQEGELTEGCITNLFLLIGGELHTPPATCGLLPGVLRRHLLASGLPVRQAVLRPADLARAEAVFVGNAVRGLVPVQVDWEGWPVPSISGTP